MLQGTWFPGLALAFGLLAAALPASAEDGMGAKLFKKRCKACHEIGKHKTGPDLAGVYGRKAGSTDFKRYMGLKGADFVWDEAHLDAYLADPIAFVKGLGGHRTAMTIKFKNREQRKAVIDYLKTLR